MPVEVHTSESVRRQKYIKTIKSFFYEVAYILYRISEGIMSSGPEPSAAVQRGAEGDSWPTEQYLTYSGLR
jgi:hypothetical protein